MQPSTVHAAGLSGKSGVFKVVKPPPKGARKRITIHNGAGSATPPSRRRSQNHAWFWSEASPALSAADPARTEILARRAGKRLNANGKSERLSRIADRFSKDMASKMKCCVPWIPRWRLNRVAAW